MKTNLPFALKLAGYATSLDNVKITPVNFDTGVRTTISTLNIFGWKKRLLKKAIKYINNDINIYPYGSEIQIYSFGGYFYKKYIWINTDLKYNIVMK